MRAVLVMRELAAVLRSMPHELEGWLVWHMDRLSMRDQDRRKGTLPDFVILHEDGAGRPRRDGP